MSVVNNKTPYFTVITPVFNRENCIKNAIDSILQQDFSDFEHIIVDDGSVDQTASIIDEAAANDNRIRVIHLDKNQGVSAARNAGIKAARGKFLLFLDSDDAFRQDTFSTLFGLLESQDNIDTIIFQGSRITTISSERPSTDQPYLILSRQQIRNHIMAEILGVRAFKPDHMFRHVLCNKCVKTAIFEDNDILFDTSKKTWEDEEVCLKVLDKSKKLIVLDQPLLIERTVETSDHLSMRYYSDGVKNVLSQYKMLLETFGKEFDLQNEFALDFHFNRIQTWIWRTMSKDNNRKNIVLEILRDEDFGELLNKRIPKGIFEKSVRIFVKLRMYLFGYTVYWLQNKINGGQTF